MNTGTEFTQSVCRKFPTSFDQTQLPTRFQLFAEILRKAREPKKPLVQEGSE
jgi:ATP phosphoribosyltransferase regulatory subunit HisZ